MDYVSVTSGNISFKIPLLPKGLNGSGVTKKSMSLADPKGLGEGMLQRLLIPLLGSNFFHFLAVFGTIDQNNRFAPPPLWLAPLLWEILDPPLQVAQNHSKHTLFWNFGNPTMLFFLRQPCGIRLMEWLTDKTALVDLKVGGGGGGASETRALFSCSF